MRHIFWLLAVVVMAVTLALSVGVAFATPPDRQAPPDERAPSDKQTRVKQNNSSRGAGHDPVTICHKGRITITVDSNALEAHLRHGDELLSEGEECPAVQETPPTTTTPEEPSAEETPQAEETSDTQQQEDQQAQDKEAQRRNTETVETCDGKTIQLKAEEKRVFDLHNKARKSKRLSSLCVSSTLTKAARAHSNEMMEKDYFSHTSSNGKTGGERLKHFGYDWRRSGENIAWGSGRHRTPEDTFYRWINSAGHRANILDRNFREIGVGSTTGDFRGIGGSTIYTVDFGTRRR